MCKVSASYVNFVVSYRVFRQTDGQTDRQLHYSIRLGVGLKVHRKEGTKMRLSNSKLLMTAENLVNYIQKQQIYIQQTCKYEPVPGQLVIVRSLHYP